MNSQLITLIIVSVCFAALLIFLFCVSKRRGFKVGGTMHIDTSRDDKDICLFTLDLPLEELKKEKAVLIKIDSESNLKSWNTD